MIASIIMATVINMGLSYPTLPVSYCSCVDIFSHSISPMMRGFSSTSHLVVENCNATTANLK